MKNLNIDIPVYIAGLGIVFHYGMLGKISTMYSFSNFAESVKF